MACEVFISYRRDDAGAQALNIHYEIKARIGAPQVFKDTAAARGGDHFPTEISNALDTARLMIAVIGPRWLTSADQFGRRRLDDPDDWVRREIERGLVRGIRLVPVLVGGASLPVRAALPESIAALVDLTRIELRDDCFEEDLCRFLDREKTVGLAPKGPEVPFPPIPPVFPERSKPEVIERALDTTIPGWKIVQSPLPGHPDILRTELMRSFRFDSFPSAIEFMRDTAAHIEDVQHHPRWENTWKTITVWLTTWDIGHQISDRDITLAQYLDRRFSEWPPPKRSTKAHAIPKG
jgi:pterin-4a-carbinolamine dehydratase